MKLQLLVLGLLHYALSLPLSPLYDLEVADDTMSVGTYIREVRAAEPENYHKTYVNDRDGEVGYLRKKEGDGKKGYQHFDSYHKKAGDNYEFEKQDSYGQDDEEQDAAYSHNHERKADEYQDPIYEEEEIEEDHRDSKKKKKQNKKPRHYEELKDGASDGNGGIEAKGHDIRDYTLPAKYTWGEEEEEEQ